MVLFVGDEFVPHLRSWRPASMLQVPSLFWAGTMEKKKQKKTGCFGFIGNTLQGTNISHLGKLGKSSSKVPLKGNMLVPRRVVLPSFYRDYDTVGQGVIEWNFLFLGGGSKHQTSCIPVVIMVIWGGISRKKNVHEVWVGNLSWLL